MVDPVKIFLTPSLITMQNLVVVPHSVCVHEGSKKLGDAEAPPHGMWTWLTPGNALLPTCYTKFRCSRSNHMGAGTGLKNCGETLGPCSLGWGVYDP